MTNKIKIALADDHPMVLDGLQAIIEDAKDMELLIRARNGQELLEQIERNPVNVVLLDIDMPVMNGAETTRILHKHHPEVRILILTMHDENHFIRELVAQGAHGYLLKTSGKDELLHAIRELHAGKNQFSGEITMKLVEQGDEISMEIKSLTEREIEILTLIAQGKSNKEIGDELFISHRTVDTHRTNLMKKLDVHNIAGLIRVAYKNNLVK